MFHSTNVPFDQCTIRPMFLRRKCIRRKCLQRKYPNPLLLPLRACCGRGFMLIRCCGFVARFTRVAILSRAGTKLVRFSESDCSFIFIHLLVERLHQNIFADILGPTNTKNPMRNACLFVVHSPRGCCNSSCNSSINILLS